MRTDRRTFLIDAAAAASLVFVGCGVADAAAQSAQRARPTRRPVVVKGRRIKTVDVHAHCAVPKATERLRRPAANQGSDDPLLLDGQALARRIEAMDAQRIATPSAKRSWEEPR